MGALEPINCFHKNTGGVRSNAILLASMRSMLACGHRVCLWTYQPERLTFLSAAVELRDANEIVPRRRVREIKNVRQLNEVIRYAFLYEQGGLWMDTDIILLRGFSVEGDYFLSSQWGHRVCGNVIYAKPFSRHMRSLFRQSMDEPGVLPRYIQSEGQELREYVANPVLFNSIDASEVHLLTKPISELAGYLQNEEVFGVHLWNQHLYENPISIPLLKPLPSLVELADKYDTDKGQVFYDRHFYSRIYEKLLSPERFSLHRLMEIGLKIDTPTRQPTPSIDLWLEYFPFAEVVGVDIDDYTNLNNDRFTAYICDEHDADQLDKVVEELRLRGQFDVIIDDNGHLPYGQQLALSKFFPLLKDGGWYFIEDLGLWKEVYETSEGASCTKELFMGMTNVDPFGVRNLPITEALFFDSHAENHLDHLLAIKKADGP